MIAASSLQVGLSWWQAWICVWVGYTISAMFVCMTCRIGATYHIGFPIVNRASFGIWGSLWPVLNRAVMAWQAVIPPLSNSNPSDILEQYMVWRPGMDRWRMRLPDDREHLAFFRRESLIDQGRRSWRDHQLCHLVCPLLARLSTVHLDSSTQDSPSLHSQGLCRAYCWYCSIHLGHRSSRRCRTNHSPACHGRRVGTRVGRHSWDHVSRVKLCNINREQPGFRSLRLHAKRCLPAAADHHSHGV